MFWMLRCRFRQSASFLIPRRFPDQSQGAYLGSWCSGNRCQWKSWRNLVLIEKEPSYSTPKSQSIDLNTFQLCIPSHWFFTIQRINLIFFRLIEVWTNKDKNLCFFIIVFHTVNIYKTNAIFFLKRWEGFGARRARSWIRL